MGAPTDRALVGRVKGGDPQAAEALLARYRDVAFGLCLAVLADPALAEDATQQALLRALSGMRSLRDGDAFGAWLCRIARNESLRVAKARERDRGRLAAVAYDAPGAESPDAGFDVDSLAEPIRRALGNESQDTTFVFLLTTLDGLSSRRVSEITGLRPDAIRQRIARARARVAATLRTAPGALVPPSDTDDSGRRSTMSTFQFSYAGGGCDATPFADGPARALYGALYEGASLEEASECAGIAPPAADAYVRLWERHRAVDRTTSGLRLLVPVLLDGDHGRLEPWCRALGRRWAEEVEARAPALRDLAHRAAPDGHVDAALEALVLWYPHSAIWRELRRAGVILPPPERPGGSYYIRGIRFGGEQEGGPPPSDARYVRTSGFGEMHLCSPSGAVLWAVRWFNVANQPDVADGLQGSGGRELPDALVHFAGKGLTRDEALDVLPDHERYSSREDLLDRLGAWDIVTADAPHRLRLPLFIGAVAEEAIGHARAVGRAVAEIAADSRESLNEIVRACSFADCNPPDVSVVSTDGFFWKGLAELIERGLFPDMPASCLAQRGLFLKDYPGLLVPED